MKKGKKPNLTSKGVCKSKGYAVEEKKGAGLGFLSLEVLEDPELFSRHLREILLVGKCAAHRHKEPWAWRAHAFRVGSKPLGLFIWLMTHPQERVRMITNEDEQAADRITQPVQNFDYAGQTPRARYQAYLNTPQWRWIRKMKLRAAKYTCEECGRRTPRQDLQVHHQNYDQKWGRESFGILRVLCRWCHGKEHPGMRVQREDFESVGEIMNGSNFYE